MSPQSVVTANKNIDLEPLLMPLIFQMGESERSLHRDSIISIGDRPSIMIKDANGLNNMNIVCIV